MSDEKDPTPSPADPPEPSEVKPEPESEPPVAEAAAAASKEAASEAPEPVEKEAASKAPKPVGKEAEAADPKAAGNEIDGLPGDEAPTTKPGRRKGKGAKNIPIGIAFIKATFNNTLVSITDMKGNVISWGSAGRSGFKGSRKSTAFAATVVAQEAGRQAVSQGMNEVEVRVQGPGAGRESAIRALLSSGLNVTSIKDVTPMPHNGCRPPKRRRV